MDRIANNDERSGRRGSAWRGIVVAVAIVAVVGGIAYSLLANARDAATEPASTTAVAQPSATGQPVEPVASVGAAPGAGAAPGDQAVKSAHGCEATCGRSASSCGSRQSTSCDPAACGR